MDCSSGFVSCKFEFCSNSECRGECYCEDSQNERLDCKENDNFGKLTPFGGMGQDDIPVQLNTPKIECRKCNEDSEEVTTSTSSATTTEDTTTENNAQGEFNFR